MSPGSTAATFVDAWRDVAVKRGVTPGSLAGSRDEAFTTVMTAAALAVPADPPSSEREVNDRLRAWLAGPGSMLATDHVELRRWLVDLKLVERDGYGRAYRRVSPPPRFADAFAALAAVDLQALGDEARRDLAQRRAERRALHESRGGRAG